MAVLREPSHIFELANTAYLELVGNRQLSAKPYGRRCRKSKARDTLNCWMGL